MFMAETTSVAKLKTRSALFESQQSLALETDTKVWGKISQWQPVRGQQGWFSWSFFFFFPPTECEVRRCTQADGTLPQADTQAFGGPLLPCSYPR